MNREPNQDKSQIQVFVVIGGMLLLLLAVSISLYRGTYNMPTEVRQRIEKNKLKNKKIKQMEADSLQHVFDSLQEKPNHQEN